MFQCSSASRKFLNAAASPDEPLPPGVSVLFSEPKIPQSTASRKTTRLNTSFSALQRAENSSTSVIRSTASSLNRFQCSSASRKFLNERDSGYCQIRRAFQCSSASRKFLNSRSFPHLYQRVRKVSVLFSEPKIPQQITSYSPNSTVRFQCSSASRKFLKNDD